MVHPLEKPAESTLGAELRRRGVSRREFLKFCGAMTAALALPPLYIRQVSEALAQTPTQRPVLVWLEFQDCAGNSESALRASHPDVESIVLDLLSWEYHETIMAGAGRQAEDVLERIVREQRGQYLAVVEGSIPLADGGVYCTIGGRTALDLARQVCPGAAAVIAAGACAWDGGFVRSSPNPTGAVGVAEAVPGLKVLNLAGCPFNAANLSALVVYYLTFKQLPPVDQFGRPLFAHGKIIHDQCERRAHFDAGQYVEEWGDEGHRRGWCLYKMGCKGPQATYNCPVVRWNDGTSWPVKAGHGCVACASNRFWDVMSPFYQRLPGVPGFGADVTAGQMGLALTGAAAAGVAIHAAASVVRSRVRPRVAGPPLTPGQPEASIPPPPGSPSSGEGPSGGQEDSDAPHSN